MSRQGFDRLNQHSTTANHEQKPKPRNKADQNHCQPKRKLRTLKTLTNQKHRPRKGGKVCRTFKCCRTKHLRRMRTWEREYNLLCGAVADERETGCISSCGQVRDLLRQPRNTRRVVFAGCVGKAAAYKVDVKELSTFRNNLQIKTADQRRIWFCASVG